MRLFSPFENCFSSFCSLAGLLCRQFGGAAAGKKLLEQSVLNHKKHNIVKKKNKKFILKCLGESVMAPVDSIHHSSLTSPDCRVHLNKFLHLHHEKLQKQHSSG